MNKFNQFALAGLLSLSFAGATLADDGYIVKVDSSVIHAVAKQYGLRVKRELGRGSGLYLVDVPNSSALQGLRTSPLVQGVQANSRVQLAEGSVTNAPKQSNAKSVYGPLFKQPGRVAYGVQPALNTISANPAQGKYGNGAGIRVAIIDTWIDASHQKLSGAVDVSSAYNAFNGDTGVKAMQETSPFIDQETSPFIDQETSPFIDQETSPFIDSTSTVLVLNQETSPFIDQETSPFIDQRSLKSPYVGHGTMLAGLVRLVAPGATIVPVIGIDWQTGYGDLASIVAAINYIADNHLANVINMSFSVPQSALSKKDFNALQSALNNAAAQGIVCVASASNSGSSALVVPASIAGVIGVGATDNSNAKASFSDYGANVNIAAPGVNVISTFPFNLYAVQSGTSFSTAFVSGAAALLKSVNPNSVMSNIDKSADPVTSTVPFGYGLLDVYGAANLAAGVK